MEDMCSYRQVRASLGKKVGDLIMMDPEAEIVYVARDASGDLNIWTEEPLYITKSWRSDYWDTDECEPGTMDKDQS